MSFKVARIFNSHDGSEDLTRNIGGENVDVITVQVVVENRRNCPNILSLLDDYFLSWSDYY